MLITYADCAFSVLTCCEKINHHLLLYIMDLILLKQSTTYIKYKHTGSLIFNNIHIV